MPIEKALLINNTNNHIKDLEDLLLIARDLGRKILRTRWINVKPLVVPYNDGYLVVVSEGEERNGKERGRGESTNNKGVGKGKAQK